MILVTGGTGTLGRRLVPMLATRAEGIRVLSRDPATTLAPGIEVLGGDVRDASSLTAAMHGARVVVSAMTGFGLERGTGPMAVDAAGNADLVRVATDEGVERVVLLSIHGAAADHPLALFRAKHRAEEVLRASSLAWTIIRPTAYAETWIRLVGEPLVTSGKTRVLGRGNNRINFVSAKDVARVIERTIDDPELAFAEIDVGGPDNVTMNELVGRFVDETSVHGSVAHVPLPILRVAATALSKAKPQLAGLMRAAILMDTTPMAFEDHSLGRLLVGTEPSSLSAVIATEYGRDAGTDAA